MKLSSLEEEKLIALIEETNNFDEINNFFMNNYWNKIGIFVISRNWKSWTAQKISSKNQWFHGPTTWKVMQRSTWRDIANLRIKQLSNSSKSQRHAWMITNLKKKRMDQLENYLLSAHKWFSKCLRVRILQSDFTPYNSPTRGLVRLGMIHVVATRGVSRLRVDHFVGRNCHVRKRIVECTTMFQEML